MSKSVLLIGVGWLGEQLVEKLSSEGLDIGICSRSREKLSQYKNSISKYLVQIDGKNFNLTSQDKECPPIKMYSHCLICLPPYPSLKEHINDIIRQLNPNATVIFCSSIGIYLPSQYINEQSSLNNEHLLFEQEVSIKKTNHIILRLGGLVGPSRHPVFSLIKNKRKVYINETINLIHSKDISSMVFELIIQDIKNKVYNIVSPNHVRKVDYYNQAAEVLLGKSIESKEGGSKKIVDGQRIVDELKMSYQFSIDNWNSFSENNN